MAKEKAQAQPSFEEAVQELEEITRALETGSLGLEDSIRAYERGMTLRALCLELLQKAEQKLEMVERNLQGRAERRAIPNPTLERDPGLFGGVEPLESQRDRPDPSEPPF